MKLSQSILIMLVILAAVTVVSAQTVNIDQLKQMMDKSAGNLTTYTYTRSAQSDFLYSNASLKTEFDLNKLTKGQIDLVPLPAMFSTFLMRARSS